MVNRTITLWKRLKTANMSTIGMLTGACFLILLALLLRISLVKAQTFDYTNFLQPWVEYLKHHGVHAFHDNFANYNSPYLILLLLGSYTHLPDIIIVKGISIFFDLLLAYSVFLIVSYYRPVGYARYAAGIATLYLPTVFLNSSLWGQCDGIYTSFVLLAFNACLRDRSLLAWMWWGISFAFKLQAIFFLPFLLFYMLYKKWPLYAPLVAVAAIIILSILPILEGRSLGSTIGIYITQAKDPVGGLTILSWYSPTFGQLLPSGGYYYIYFKHALIILGAAAGITTIMMAFFRRVYTKQQVLNILALSLFVIPFLLPGIHERYLYSAEVISFVCAFIIPRMIRAAVAMQVITVITYNSYFTGGSQPPQIPYAILSLVVLGIIGLLGHQLYCSLQPNGLLKEDKRFV